MFGKYFKNTKNVAQQLKEENKNLFWRKYDVENSKTNNDKQEVTPDFIILHCVIILLYIIIFPTVFVLVIFSHTIILTAVILYDILYLFVDFCLISYRYISNKLTSVYNKIKNFFTKGYERMKIN
jgi:uncharacterized membrane protein